MKKLLKVSIPSRQILMIITVICVVIMGITLFSDSIMIPVKAVTSYVVIPMQRGINSVGSYIYGRVEFMKDMKMVYEENETLKEQVALLTEENNMLLQDKYELSRLRELYKLDQKYYGYTKIGARVIGKESGNWFSQFTIDHGADDGIEVDMNVIADGGLVGIVTEVGSNYAIVRSIIDDSSSVSGMLLGTGDTCAVEGSLTLMDSGYINVRYFKKDVIVNDGDKIVTSNISSKYLEGILIGYVKDVTQDPNSLTQSGHIIPAVDFEHLQEVLVILEKK
jgi:rod shape-determining protein MreC